MAMGQVRGRRGRSCQRKARGRQLLQTARQDCGVVDVGECVLTFWVRRRLDHVEESHVGDVVDVYLDFEDDDERLAVELDGEDGGREEELADHRLPLEFRVDIVHDSEHSKERKGWVGGGRNTFVLTICSFRGLDCG